MGSKYFDDYHPDKLQNQKLLCRILKKTKYSIETDDANPMTIRLLVTYDNLHMIKCLTSQWHSIGPELLITDKENSHITMVSGATSYDVIVFPGNDTEKINLIDVHKALFGFFSNLNSAMDRLAYEIGYLYEIRNKMIDWGLFFGNAFKKPIHPIPLLESIVNSHDKTKIDWIIECRNRLLHDGILRFELKNSIYLPEYPRDSARNCSLLMETACDKAFWEIVSIIDAIYGSLLGKINAEGLPFKP